MSLIGSRKSGISARLVVASARGVVVMADKIPAGSLDAAVPGCAWLPAALWSAMTTHKAVHVASANAPLTLVDVETTPPGPGHIRIAVAACGVSGTANVFVTRGFPTMPCPLPLAP